MVDTHGKKVVALLLDRAGSGTGIIQSLITTCRLQDINPYTYLTDVLLRIGEHPARQIDDLTPRLYRQQLASNPLRADLFSQDHDHLILTPTQCQ